MHERKNKKQHMRLKSKFHRILLISDKDTQTVALIPDSAIAHDIIRLFKQHLEIREGQHLSSVLCELRNDPKKNDGYFDWNATEER